MTTPRSTAELLMGVTRPKRTEPDIFNDDYPAGLLPAPRPGRSDYQGHTDIFDHDPEGAPCTDGGVGVPGASGSVGNLSPEGDDARDIRFQALMERIRRLEEDE